MELHAKKAKEQESDPPTQNHKLEGNRIRLCFTLCVFIFVGKNMCVCLRERERRLCESREGA